MKILPGDDKTPGFENYCHDSCEDCGGIVCGFLHPGEHACDCGEEYENDD